MPLAQTQLDVERDFSRILIPRQVDFSEQEGLGPIGAKARAGSHSGMGKTDAGTKGGPVGTISDLVAARGSGRTPLWEIVG